MKSTVIDKTENEKLLMALRHRYINVCELHLAYEKEMEKSIEVGDLNMSAYYQYRADEEWQKAERVRQVIADIVGILE